jgi:hypothetical protein
MDVDVEMDASRPREVKRNAVQNKIIIKKAQVVVIAFTASRHCVRVEISMSWLVRAAWSSLDRLGISVCCFSKLQRQKPSGVVFALALQTPVEQSRVSFRAADSLAPLEMQC